MRLEIPPSRIHLLKNAPECSISLSGGAERKRDRSPATRYSKPQDIFLLVDDEGSPLAAAKSDRSLPFRAYYAKKPCLAAVKAYYALMRHTKPQAISMSEDGIEGIETEALNVADATEVEKYMKLVRSTKAEPSAIIRLRRPDENNVRSYYVSYKRVAKPNAHEIRKGITKVAVAQLRSSK